MTDKNFEKELRDDLLGHMPLIMAHLHEGNSLIIDALLDLGEETPLDPIGYEKWNLKDWQYFIVGMEDQLKSKQNPHADDVRSTLDGMRAKIDEMRLLGLISLEWPETGSRR